MFELISDCLYIPRAGWAVVLNLGLEKLIKMLKLSKLLNQALCFGNFLILLRECGRQAKPCAGRVSACETDLCHVGKEVKHLPSRVRNVRPRRPPPPHAPS